MISLPSVRPFFAPSSMNDSATFGTKKLSGTFGGSNTAYALTTTGYVKVLWWDGTSNVFSSASPASPIFYSKAIVAPYNTTAEKQFTIYSCDASGNRKGYLVEIVHQSALNSPNSFANVSSCRKLTNLQLSGVLLTSYTHNPNIDALTLNTVGLTSLDLTNQTKLGTLNLLNCSSLSSVNITGCTGITYIDLTNSQIATITGLSSSTQTGLYSFIAAANAALTSINLNNFTSLVWINLVSCSSLTSIRAQNCQLYLVSNNTYSSFFGGAWLSGCNLNAAALNQFYTDLGNANGIIRVDGNPGTASDTPATATAKGYTVLGS